MSIFLLGIAGCCGSQGTTTSTHVQFTPKATDLVHDVGAVIEGTKVEHVFATQNNFPIPISIADDTDIEKTCGCTTLDVSTRRLDPGETATIRMHVDTAGKRGRFRVGGLIRWRTDDGRAWPVNLSLDGTAKTILAAEPGIVQFSPADVAEQRTKEVLVFNSLDVDWSTLNVHIEPPYVELLETTVDADHAKLVLRPCPPSEVVDFSATLRFSADLAAVKGGVRNCAIDVPLQGSRHIDLQVLPRVVFASWSRDVKKGTARFLVRGLDSLTPTSISSISCDGLRAAWATKDISSTNTSGYRTLQVELNLSEPDDPAFDSTQVQSIRIAFVGGRSLEVLIHLVTQQERS